MAIYVTCTYWHGLEEQLYHTSVYNDKTQSRNSYNFNFCYQFIFSSLNCYYNNYYIEDLYIYLIIHVHEPSYNQNDTDVELTYI